MSFYHLLARDLQLYGFSVITYQKSIYENGWLVECKIMKKDDFLSLSGVNCNNDVTIATEESSKIVYEQLVKCKPNSHKRCFGVRNNEKRKSVALLKKDVPMVVMPAKFEAKNLNRQRRTNNNHIQVNDRDSWSNKRIDNTGYDIYIDSFNQAPRATYQVNRKPAKGFYVSKHVSIDDALPYPRTTEEKVNLDNYQKRKDQLDKELDEYMRKNEKEENLLDKELDEYMRKQETEPAKLPEIKVTIQNEGNLEKKYELIGKLINRYIDNVIQPSVLEEKNDDSQTKKQVQKDQLNEQTYNLYEKLNNKMIQLSVLEEKDDSTTKKQEEKDQLNSSCEKLIDKMMLLDILDNDKKDNEKIFPIFPGPGSGGKSQFADMYNKMSKEDQEMFHNPNFNPGFINLDLKEKKDNEEMIMPIWVGNMNNGKSKSIQLAKEKIDKYEPIIVNNTISEKSIRNNTPLSEEKCEFCSQKKVDEITYHQRQCMSGDEPPQIFAIHVICCKQRALQ